MEKVLGLVLVLLLGIQINLVETYAKGSYSNDPENVYYGSGSENEANAVESHFEINEDGTICVYYIVWESGDPTLYIDTINTDGRRISRKTIDFFGNRWGGTIYEAPDHNYYIATGENEGGDVFYISKYDSQWNFLDKVNISAEDSYTRKPFISGNSDMTLTENNILAVHAARGRLDGHQSNVTFLIDTENMQLIYTSQWGIDYVSHSFNQFADSEGSTVVTVDHGDGYPRGVIIHKYDVNKPGNGAIYSNYKEHLVFSIDGEIGDNYTGITVDGLGTGENNYLVVGTKYFEEASNNIFAAVIEKDLSSSKLKQLIYLPDNQNILNMSLLEMEGNKFLLLYGIGEEQYYKATNYMVISSAGEILKQGSKEVPFYCTGEPAYRDGKIVWGYYIDNSLGNFLVLNQWNIETGEYIVSNVDVGTENKIKSLEFEDGSVLEIKEGEEGEIIADLFSDVFKSSSTSMAPAVWKVTDPSVVEIKTEESVLSRASFEQLSESRAHKKVQNYLRAKRPGKVTLSVLVGDKKGEIEIFVTNSWGITDVPMNNWYYNTVSEVYKLGLMTGIDDTHFAPDKSMSRGMVATALYRMAGAPNVQYRQIFIDVPKSAYYAQAITWAYQNKVINGYGNGKFGPDDNVTREEMAVMLCNFARFNGMKVNSNQNLGNFKDYTSITAYAVPSIKWTVEKGIITGTEDKKLNPISEATRAECAKMLLLSYKLIQR